MCKRMRKQRSMRVRWVRQIANIGLCDGGFWVDVLKCIGCGLRSLCVHHCHVSGCGACTLYRGRVTRCAEFVLGLLGHGVKYELERSCDESYLAASYGSNRAR